MPRVCVELRAVVAAASFVAICLSPRSAASQALAPPPSTATLPRPEKPRVVCPGDPAGNLASFDCNFTPSLRFEEFIKNGVTDQALDGALFYGAIAQLRGDPPEWEQDWHGYGSRVGSRYAQNLAKSLTAYAVGALPGIRDDPRHVTYLSDPGRRCPKANGRPCSASDIGPRIGHAFVDWATVRRSARDGNGRRIPNVGLFAAALVSGVIGNAWYPERLTTRTEVAKRTASSLATALGMSFSTEFGSDIGRGAGVVIAKLAGAHKQPGGPQP